MAEALRAGQGVASYAELTTAGLTRSALRWAVDSGELRRLAPGYLTSSRGWETSDSRARHLLELRAALLANPGSVAAGASAAVVWGLPLPGPPGLPVVLRPRTVTRPQHGERSRTTVARRAWLRPEDHVRGPAGLAVTTPARTFVDLARGSSFPWALATADAVRRGHGCSVAELLEAAAAQRGNAGAPRAARAAAVAVRDAESPLESLARGVQVELGLPVPRTQVWVGERAPEYRVDMLVEEFATVVEADGRTKYSGPGARDDPWSEKRRTDRLLDLGYDCHRFVLADLARPVAWGRSLVRVFERSQRRQGRPPPSLRLPWLT
jgi:very-short-patch-repair endonuclease